MLTLLGSTLGPMPVETVMLAPSDNACSTGITSAPFGMASALELETMQLEPNGTVMLVPMGITSTTFVVA